MKRCFLAWMIRIESHGRQFTFDTGNKRIETDKYSQYPQTGKYGSLVSTLFPTVNMHDCTSQLDQMIIHLTNFLFELNVHPGPDSVWPKTSRVDRWFPFTAVLACQGTFKLALQRLRLGDPLQFTISVTVKSKSDTYKMKITTAKTVLTPHISTRTILKHCCYRHSSFMKPDF